MADESDFSSFESSATGGGSSMMAPLMIALAGVLLGGAALYFSLTGSGQADVAQNSLEEMSAKVEGLETRLRDLEAKYSAQAGELAAANQQMRQMARDTQGALDQVGVEINRNREQIDLSADKLAELIDELNRAPRATAPSPSAPRAAESSSDAASRLPVADVDSGSPTVGPVVQEKTHTIRSGDTFSKLSQDYGVSVAAILAANPDVDPRRLAVGQKITIPAK